MDPGLFLILAVCGTIGMSVYLYLRSDADERKRDYALLEDQGYHEDGDGSDERRIEEIQDRNGPGFD